MPSHTRLEMLNARSDPLETQEAVLRHRKQAYEMLSS